MAQPHVRCGPRLADSLDDRPLAVPEAAVAEDFQVGKVKQLHCGLLRCGGLIHAAGRRRRLCRQDDRTAAAVRVPCTPAVSHDHHTRAPGPGAPVREASTAADTFRVRQVGGPRCLPACQPRSWLRSQARHPEGRQAARALTEPHLWRGPQPLRAGTWLRRRTRCPCTLAGAAGAACRASAGPADAAWLRPRSAVGARGSTGSTPDPWPTCGTPAPRPRRCCSLCRRASRRQPAGSSHAAPAQLCRSRTARWALPCSGLQACWAACCACRAGRPRRWRLPPLHLLRRTAAGPTR